MITGVVGAMLFGYNIFIALTGNAMDGNQLVIGIVALMIGLFLAKLLGAKPKVQA